MRLIIYLCLSILICFTTQLTLKNKLKQVNSQTNFQIQLFKQLNNEENVVISPLSIYLALALTSNGAVEQTQSSIINTIENPNSSIYSINKNSQNIMSIVSLENQGNNKLTIANAVMSREEPLTTFLNLAKNVYNTYVSKLENANQVNSWVSKATNGKINQIIQNLDNSMEMIILNAIYFYGEWQTIFKDTQEADFTTASNQKIKCQMMNQKFYTKYYENDKMQMIDLPYKNSKISATIILPKNDINSFINNLGNDLDTYIKNLKNENVDLRLPKFEINYSTSLKDVLIELGMKLPFTDNADFSNLSPKPLKISDILHKTYLKVAEKGTEAAAVTAVVMEMSASINEIEINYINMTVDKPFLFIIRDPDVNNYLFLSKIGKV